MSYVLFFLHSCYISTYIANFKYLSLIWKAQVCEKENSELHEMLSVQQTGVKRGGLWRGAPGLDAEKLSEDREDAPREIFQRNLVIMHCWEFDREQTFILNYYF